MLAHHVNIRMVLVLSLTVGLSYIGLSDGHLTRLQHAHSKGTHTHNCHIAIVLWANIKRHSA